MNACEQYLPELCAYLDGEAENPAAIEMHLAQCSACRALLAQYQQIDRQIAAVAIPETLHSKLMEAVSAEQKPKKHRRFAFGSATAVAAVAAVLVLAIGSGWITPPSFSKSAPTANQNAEMSAARPYAPDLAAIGGTNGTPSFAPLPEQAPLPAPADAAIEEAYIAEDTELLCEEPCENQTTACSEPPEPPQEADPEAEASEPEAKDAGSDAYTVLETNTDADEERLSYASGIATGAMQQTDNLSSVAQAATESISWIIYHQTPEEVATLFEGLFFVLQDDGSWVAVCDMEQLEALHEQLLGMFEEAYSEGATEIRLIP